MAPYWTALAHIVTFLALATCASAQLRSTVPVTPLLELQAGRIIPDVITGLSTPAKNLTISYPGGELVSYGNELLLTRVTSAPAVSVLGAAEPGALYTLVLSNPDSTTGTLHWLVANIPGTATTNITSTGVALAPYQAPTVASGLDRFVFTFFKQNASLPTTLPANRTGFAVETFAAAYKLGNPVFANYFVSEAAGQNLTASTNGAVVQTLQLTKADVIPDVVPTFTPSAVLSVAYDSGALTYGQILTPAQLVKEPSVLVQGLTSNTSYVAAAPYFTLALIDPDSPDPATSTGAQTLQLLKANIPTKNLTTSLLATTTAGDVLEAYAAPAPVSGLHRYIFVLYGQTKLINATSPASRAAFNVTSFAIKNGLGAPLAAFYFQSIQSTAAAPATAPVATAANKTVAAVVPTPTVAKAVNATAGAPVATKAAVATPSPTAKPAAAVPTPTPTKTANKTAVTAPATTPATAANKTAVGAVPTPTPTKVAMTTKTGRKFK